MTIENFWRTVGITATVLAVFFVFVVTQSSAGLKKEVSNTSNVETMPFHNSTHGRSCIGRCEAQQKYTDDDRCPDLSRPCLDEQTGECLPYAYICLAVESNDGNSSDETQQISFRERQPQKLFCRGRGYDPKRQLGSYRLCQLSNNSQITDNDILVISQSLFDADVDRVAVDVAWQGKTTDGARQDMAPNRLFNELPKEFNREPLYVKQLALFVYYERDETVSDPLSSEEWAAVDSFLDEVMKTEVMRRTHTFLASKGLVERNAGKFQDQLWQIWYSQYRRSGALSSSGAEHVQVGETKRSEISGFHNWIRFAQLENDGHVNYLGYVRIKDLGNSGAYIIQNPFFWDTFYKPVGSFFVGTSPAYDIAIFTLCFYTRPNSICKISAGRTKVSIQTFSIDYNGRALVGSAFPLI